MKSLNLEILNYNYWEHFKAEKELAQIYEPSHPKRVAIHNEANKILEMIHKLKKKGKTK